jgi:hypothetical protein
VDTVPLDDDRRADATTALAALIRRWSNSNAATAPIKERGTVDAQEHHPLADHVGSRR